MEKRYVVPEGMLRAAIEVCPQANRPNIEFAYEYYRPILEAALGWLAENPIMPTAGQADSMRTQWRDTGTQEGPFFYTPMTEAMFTLDKWQRRMFLAPKPDYGFIACDTCRAKPGSPTLCRGCLHNRDVIEALRRQIGKVG